MRRFSAAALLILAGEAFTPAPASAAIEEFENWSIRRRELDDENGLDDLQRSPNPQAQWRWRELRQGARVGMGCATTEFWEVNLDAKVNRDVSDHVEAGFQLYQQQELGEEVDWTEFASAYRSSRGLWLGAGYRPSFEKEEHDAALYAGYRRSWTEWARLRVGFEDMLNNFWDDRTRYIEDKDRRVYENLPIELEIAGLWRRGVGPGVSVRLVLLPEYERHETPSPFRFATGEALETSGWLFDFDAISGEGGRGVFGLRARHKGTDRESSTLPSTTIPDTSALDRARLRDIFVRPWGELRVGETWRLQGQLQARWSEETHFDGTRNHRLETQHLGGLASAVWSAWNFLDVEAGLAIDRVQVEQNAGPGYEVFSHGDRTESRAILSLDFHWNGARLVLIETLEGDDEGYQTVGFHDKGFVHLVIEF
jgi:hypothetical protein